MLLCSTLLNTHLADAVFSVRSAHQPWVASRAEARLGLHRAELRVPRTLTCWARSSVLPTRRCAIPSFRPPTPSLQAVECLVC